MQTIEGLVNDAETALSHGKLDRSLILFSQACVKLVQHIRSQAVFEQVPGRKPGIRRIKSVIPNSSRLFNLARLCLTEIETVFNDEVDVDDIDDDDSEDDNDDNDDDGEIDYDSALNHLTKPINSGPSTTPACSEDLDFKVLSLSNKSASNPPPTQKPLNNAGSRTDSLPLSSNPIITPPSPSSQDSSRSSSSGSNTYVDSSSYQQQHSPYQQRTVAPPVSKPSSPSNLYQQPPHQQSPPNLAISLPPQTEYMPIIPTSPLSQYVQSWTVYQIQATQELQQLQQLRDPASLAATKRHLENLSLIKEKLASVKQQIQQTQSKTVLDFTPKSIAATIAGYDYDLIFNINIEEMNNYSPPANGALLSISNPPPPRTIRVPLDFGLWLTRLVQSTILSSDIINSRAKVMHHWIDVAARLYELKDHQGVYSVISGLRSPPIARLVKSWGAISKKVMNTVNELSNIFDRYDQTMNKTVAPFIPALQPLILQNISLWNGIESMKSGAKYDPDPKERTPVVSHFIVTQRWVNEDEVNQRASKPEVKK